jgi:cytochrome oxidase assembly protein ShyY1
MRLRIGQYHCQSSPVLLIGFLVLLCLFISLSVWQQQRAIKKKILFAKISAFKTLSHTKDLTLPQLVNDFQQLGQGISDARLVVNGHFLNMPLLYLDNKSVHGVSGYQLLAFFAVNNSDTRLLVNLGWHPLMNQRREPLPTLQLQTGPTQLVGRVYAPQEGAFHLGNQMIEANSRLQWIDIPRLSQEKQLLLYPFLLRLISSTPEVSQVALNRNWPDRETVGITPEKHFGYALQWALFALILIGIWIKTQWKKQPQ